MSWLRRWTATPRSDAARRTSSDPPDGTPEAKPEGLGDSASAARVSAPVTTGVSGRESDAKSVVLLSDSDDEAPDEKGPTGAPSELALDAGEQDAGSLSQGGSGEGPTRPRKGLGFSVDLEALPGEDLLADKDKTSGEHLERGPDAVVDICLKENDRTQLLMKLDEQEQGTTATALGETVRPRSKLSMMKDRNGQAQRGRPNAALFPDPEGPQLTSESFVAVEGLQGWIGDEKVHRVTLMFCSDSVQCSYTPDGDSVPEQIRCAYQDLDDHSIIVKIPSRYKSSHAQHQNKCGIIVVLAPQWGLEECKFRERIISEAEPVSRSLVISFDYSDKWSSVRERLYNRFNASGFLKKLVSFNTEHAKLFDRAIEAENVDDKETSADPDAYYIDIHRKEDQAQKRVVDTRPRNLTKTLKYCMTEKDMKTVLEVTPQDFDTLRPRAWLNDTIIDFYLCWLMNHVPQHVKNKVHVFSSFFYKKLTGKHLKGQEAWAEVRRWTSEVNIFEKDYLLIPINESGHWLLAVVWRPGMWREGGQAYLLVLDSLGSKNSSICDTLMSYMEFEWDSRYNSRRECREQLNEQKLKPLSPSVPIQPNFCDCGIFVLHNAELLLLSLSEDMDRDLSSRHGLPVAVQMYDGKEVTLYKRALLQELIFLLSEGGDAEQVAANAEPFLSRLAPKVSLAKRRSPSPIDIMGAGSDGGRELGGVALTASANAVNDEDVPSRATKSSYGAPSHAKSLAEENGDDSAQPIDVSTSPAKKVQQSRQGNVSGPLSAMEVVVEVESPKSRAGGPILGLGPGGIVGSSTSAAGGLAHGCRKINVPKIATGLLTPEVHEEEGNIVDLEQGEDQVVAVHGDGDSRRAPREIRRLAGLRESTLPTKRPESLGGEPLFMPLSAPVRPRRSRSEAPARTIMSERGQPRNSSLEHSLRRSQSPEHASLFVEVDGELPPTETYKFGRSKRSNPGLASREKYTKRARSST